MKAHLNNLRISPRKVRLVARLIKGKQAAEALQLLKTVPRGATGPLEKLLRSAIANARVKNALKPEEIRVADVRVDAGKTLKRFMPRARGSGAPIRKRMSHVTLLLAARAPVKKELTRKEVKV